MTARRVYLDTSVLVSALLGPGEPHFTESAAAITGAQTGAFEAVTSALVLAEIVGIGKHRAGVSASDAKRKQQQALDFARGIGARYVEVSERHGRKAAELSIQFALKGPDALHLALAVETGCTHLYTCDGGLLKIADQIPGLTACVPEAPTQPPLY